MWTVAETEFFRLQYGRMPTGDLEVLLGRGRFALADKARHAGLALGRRGDAESMAAAARRTGLPRTFIRTALERAGLRTTPPRNPREVFDVVAVERAVAEELERRG